MELKDYIEKMENDYQMQLNLINNEFRKNGNKNLFWFWLDNNSSVKKYISILTSKDTNLSSSENNEEALRSTFKRHVEFMNYLYELCFDSVEIKESH
jgi:hypothetical protein